MTEPEALDWIATLFEEPRGSLLPETRRDQIEAWDSLGVLTLMAGLDADFGITMSDDDFQKITTVGDVLAVMRQNGALSDAEVG
jgi:acyl carrier protein